MKSKKRLAAEILKVSPKKVRFSSAALEEIKKAITRSDMRGLIAVGKVGKTRGSEGSRVRARFLAAQKRKGRRKGKGCKKGTKYTIETRKEKWIKRIRVQRLFLKNLRDKGLIPRSDYQTLYAKSRGGYFRSVRHIKLYLKEHNIIKAK
ncbi:MAG: 50S ribosomal protein L19e [Nanoarchaeota archaeon]